MKYFPSQTPKNGQENQNLVHLVGPDGWQFSVNRTPENTTQFQVSKTSRHEETLNLPNADLDSPTPVPLAESFTVEPPAVPEHLQNVESIDGNAMMASLIAGGVMKWRVRRMQKGIQRQGDLDAHSGVATKIVERHDEVKPYNPLAGFGKTHRSDKIPEGGLVMKKHSPVRTTESRTRTQERSALRANLREDAINNRVGRADKYTDLYGEVILDKKELKKELKNGGYSYQQKKAMKQAGRKARRLTKTSGRINNRLARQAEGNDLHGKKIKAVKKITGN